MPGLEADFARFKFGTIGTLNDLIITNDAMQMKIKRLSDTCAELVDRVNELSKELKDVKNRMSDATEVSST